MTDPGDDSDVSRGRTFAEEREAFFAGDEHRHARARLEARGVIPGEEPTPANRYAANGDVTDLMNAWDRFQMHEARAPDAPTPPAKPKLDLSLNIPTIVMLAGMLVGGVRGWDALDQRISANERGVQESKDRATKYVPVIEAVQEAIRGQASENKGQSDTINAIRESIAEERRQRNNDGTETRRALADIAKTLNELVTEQAVQKDRQGRRTDLGSPERDAQVQGPQFHPR